MTGPDGNSYQYQYDPMSNLGTMQSWNPNCGCWSPLATASYNWTGERTSLSYSSFTESRTYNSLLQLTRLQNYGLDMQYIYQAGQNNGRIVQSVDSVRGETVNYAYDVLNRLTSAEEASGKWGNAFSYDGWGTMNGKTYTPGQAAAPGTVALPSPRDANGNYVAGWSGSPYYQYDVENRMLNGGVWTPGNVWSQAVNFGYDPWGKRVSNCCAQTSGQIASLYTFYGINGKRLATYQATVNDDLTYTVSLQASDLYFGGTLVQANGVWVSTDRLGSVRANSNGEQFAYYSYGQERTSTTDGREKFGTYFRDFMNGAVGQDYADQRYYDAYSGSFWSADPGGNRSANRTNPGSWNRYVYSFSDPVNFADPSGRDGCSVEYGVPCFSVTGTSAPESGNQPSPGGSRAAYGSGNAMPLMDMSMGGDGPPPAPLDPPFDVKGLPGFFGAYSLAVAALGTSDCAKHFGLAGSSSMNPSALLAHSVELSGTDTATLLSFDTTGDPRVGATTSCAGTVVTTTDAWAYTALDRSPIESTRATIDVNLTSWNNASTVWRAQMLIHELGHVFDMLLGAGGSDFVSDALPNGAPDPAAEARNAAIMQDCIRN